MAGVNPTLGPWADQIIDGATALEPRIGEAQFKQDILPLIEAPFDPQVLRQYQPYVGELTMPLHVLGDDGETVLFTVPPLAPRPRPTVAAGDNLTAANILKAMERQHDLGDVNTDEKIARYMMSITGFSDYYKVVIAPLAAILHRYGLTLKGPQGTTPAASETTREVEAPAPSTSFTDDYED